MALTAYPFHRTTGDLLPGYRDAYLRGDLSAQNTALVDDYLKNNPAKGTEAYKRFHTLHATGHQVRPVGWLQQQFDLIRTEPVRFRRRAGSMVLVATLLGGAVFAGADRAATPVSTPTVDETILADAATSLEVASSLKMKFVKGRILDENGHPLVGATILHQASGRGAGTDAQGNYTLAVPANQPVNLQFGYGGYAEEEARVSSSTYNVTLLPRGDSKKAKRHWWSF